LKHIRIFVGEIELVKDEGFKVYKFKSYLGSLLSRVVGLNGQCGKNGCNVLKQYCMTKGRLESESHSLRLLNKSQSHSSEYFVFR